MVDQDGVPVVRDLADAGSVNESPISTNPKWPVPVRPADRLGALEGVLSRPV